MKRLVLCCDGTWNRADQASDGEPCPTNVVKLAYRVAKRDPDNVPQIVYYDHGVGTGNPLDRLVGGAFGTGLEENIHDAYRFLIANYEEGDQIFLFGFSRGAFTARSLGGMIRNCGILKRASVGEYTAAIDLYRNRGQHPTADPSARFRDRHSVCGDAPVKIRVIGVWDTVGALGIPIRALGRLTRGRYEFHDTELSGSVENGFHALAIDERRGPFAPTLWSEKPKGHRVEQVWFAGVHGDVGLRGFALVVGVLDTHVRRASTPIDGHREPMLRLGFGSRLRGIISRFRAAFAPAGQGGGIIALLMLAGHGALVDPEQVQALTHEGAEQAGELPDWPGEEVYPPQPMNTQTRDVLEAYGFDVRKTRNLEVLKATILGILDDGLELEAGVVGRVALEPGLALGGPQQVDGGRNHNR